MTKILIALLLLSSVAAAEEVSPSPSPSPPSIVMTPSPPSIVMTPAPPSIVVRPAGPSSEPSSEAVPPSRRKAAIGVMVGLAVAMVGAVVIGCAVGLRSSGTEPTSSTLGVHQVTP